MSASEILPTLSLAGVQGEFGTDATSQDLLLTSRAAWPSHSHANTADTLPVTCWNLNRILTLQVPAAVTTTDYWNIRDAVTYSSPPADVSQPCGGDFLQAVAFTTCSFTLQALTCLIVHVR